MTDTSTPGGVGLASLVPEGARRLTAHELVRGSLRRAVLSGQLPAGTRLVQADIAAQLEVSTTPVREALRDLATEGFLRLDPHRGAIVRSIDVAEVREIFELRQVLEPLAVRKAIPHATEEELDKAAALCDQMHSADPREWVELNRQFHELLVEPARSPRLKAILRNLRDSASMYVGVSLGTESGRHVRKAEEHRAMLEAYRRHDPDQAAALTAQHLDTAIDELRELNSTHGQRD